jgi:DNA-binding CsgD family transcriptional regulator
MEPMEADGLGAWIGRHLDETRRERDETASLRESGDPRGWLDPREREVLALRDEGKTRAEIGRVLNVSASRVKHIEDAAYRRIATRVLKD